MLSCAVKAPFDIRAEVCEETLANSISIDPRHPQKLSPIFLLITSEHVKQHKLMRHLLLYRMCRC